MRSFPLFVIGAPRSGTTFLCSVLNVHPSIELTNECGIFVLMKHMLESARQRPDLIRASYVDSFAAFSHRTIGAWVERFYREELRVSAPIWGDKHPPYADPTVLSGRLGSVARVPMSGSCLHLIRKTLPSARFIHIHRHPVHVARSLLHKRWIGSIEDGVRVWDQYVTEIVAFLSELPEEDKLTFSYLNLIERPETTAADIGRFLGLEDASPISDFLLRQRDAPTPFSDPVTDIANLYLIPASNTEDDRYLPLAGPAATQLGYTADGRM